MVATQCYVIVAVTAVLQAILICSVAESSDVVTTALTVYNTVSLEMSAVLTTDQQNLNSTEPVEENFSTASPLLKSYTESLNNSDDGFSDSDIDILDRFEKIRQNAKDDPIFRSRAVQYPACCLEDSGEMCDGLKCLIYFITSVESDNITINSYSMKICDILYQIQTCDDHKDDEMAQECADYCYCITAKPVLSIVSDAVTALYFGCVFMTLCVYASIPRLRTLYGKCLMSYLVAVLASESFSTVRNKNKNVCSDTSVAIEYLLSFFTLARYCWVNMLCVEICLVCRSFYSVRHHSQRLRPKGRQKFFYYSLAVWGGAAALFAIIHVIPGFISKIVNLVVIFLLLFSSCVPLIVTLKRLWATNDRQLAEVSRRKLNWFYMTSKLVCLSGTGKICSLIIYWTVRGTVYYDWLFILLKVEGPLLFILFVCNCRVRGRVRERLSELEWISKN